MRAQRGFAPPIVYQTPPVHPILSVIGFAERRQGVISQGAPRKWPLRVVFLMNWSGPGTEPMEAVVVNATTLRTLLDDVESRLTTGRGFSVATLNLDHVVKLRRLPEFRTAYAAHSHVTADGNPIVWLSRLAGQRVELVPGSELIEPIAALAARHGVPIALFGAADAALNGAADVLARRYPDLTIAAKIAPPMGFDPASADADAAIEALQASGARVVFLALGAPKQEVFAARALMRHPGMGFLSIGAGLDFLAGTQTRAPAAVRAVAAEWLWRLAGDPRRLAARYAACLAVLPRLSVRAIQCRLSRSEEVPAQ